MDPGKAPTLPRIPALAISADEARRILARIEGADAPAEFTGGLSIRYRLGPGPAAVRMHVKMLGERRPIFNVIGSIPGSGTPDRWVMLGTHHDAWTFGGTDPGSAVAVLMEVARGLSALRNEGWRPTRSIKFCFWDAEEFGLVGSTEFAEDRAREIREKAVAYINTDMYMAGSLVAGGLPSLREFVAGIARDVPGENGSLFSNWVEAERQRGPAERAGDGIPELRPLGSGADFVAFQDHLGVPALSLELLTPSGWVFGTYHSAYDTRRTFERHGDPEYRQGPRLAHVLGLAAMRLAGADALPFRYRHYATTISSFVGDVERWVADAGLPARDRAVGSLRRAAAEVDERAGALDGTVDRLLGASVIANRACLGELNDALARIEQTLLSPDESPGASWYKHVLYGWNIYSLYDGQPLPRVAEAIRVRDVPAVDREIDRVRAAVTRMRDALGAAAIICR
jgi:N-acetylated-alpha-linked acidic dipeptidase